MESNIKKDVLNENLVVPKLLRSKAEIVPIMDAIYVISGKWRIPITIALMEGNKRFSEIQKDVSKITSKVLSHELKEMELNGFVEKTYQENPFRIEYELTDYSWSIKSIILLLRDFGIKHREKIRNERGRNCKG